MTADGAAYGPASLSPRKTCRRGNHSHGRWSAGCRSREPHPGRAAPRVSQPGTAMEQRADNIAELAGKRSRERNPRSHGHRSCRGMRAGMDRTSGGSRNTRRRGELPQARRGRAVGKLIWTPACSRTARRPSGKARPRTPHRPGFLRGRAGQPRRTGHRVDNSQRMVEFLLSRPAAASFRVPNSPTRSTGA